MSSENNLRKVEGFERVFNIVGGGGLFQWSLLFICSLQALVLSMHHIGYVFLGAVPEHWCEVEGLENVPWTSEQIKNLSIPRKALEKTKYESCLYYDLNYADLTKYYTFEEAFSKINYTNVGVKECHKWVYDKSIYESTTVTQFDLVCDRRYLVATIQATYMGGVFAGSLLMGALSDNLLGRRNSVLCSIVLVLFAALAASFSYSYTTFVTARFFIAMGVAGCFQNTFSLLTEFCDSEHRAILGLFFNIPFAIGYMFMALYGYLIRNWMNLQLAFTVSNLVLISYFWILPNSPRWLATRGRDEEAITILNRIAKLNRKPLPHKLELMVILESCRDKDSQNSSNNEQDSCLTKTINTFRNVCTGYVDLIRTPELRKRSFLIWILFMSVTLVYYGLSFDSALLTNDPFFLVFLSGLMEIPGYTLVVPFTAKWGRTPTVSSTFILTGIMCISVACTENAIARVILAMSGKLFISGCFAVIYLLGAELYPTSSRATGLGSGVLMGRVGSIYAPYLVDLTKVVYSDLPSIVFGVTGILSGLITLFLPETKNSEMPDSVKSVELHAKDIDQGDVMTKIVRRLSHASPDNITQMEILARRHEHSTGSAEV